MTQPQHIAAYPMVQPQAPGHHERAIEISEDMKADFHRTSEEDFQRRTQEIAKTIGRHRLPIESLQGEFMWNSLMVQKFQVLSQTYSAWRRSRGDGNCFYRCLGVLLLEHFCRPDTPLQEFYAIYTEMLSQNRHFVLSLTSEQDLGIFKLFAKLLKDLYNKRTNSENAFQHLQYCLQRQSVDKAMIVAMRSYTASYLQMNCQHPDLAPFIENLPALISEIREYGKEAEGLALIAAARCFSAVLHIFTIDNKSSDITETIYGPESPGCYPSFSLLHLPGHYNYLIRREVHEADHYDFASNSYSPISIQQIIGYEQFRINS
jgi:ubiquitin thioesterase protein OTUB1